MFDGITGSKFSAKCKQAVKNTTMRATGSRKKKQAMLNFLKKDVADLLAQGHDQHAFNRIDGVVSESNLIRCYDLIAEFCDCIAAHLPVMQKLKRECPPECVEAVATLIFAAARFSDLPELCRLRSLFTERYGSAMEPSVNPEIIEMVSKHSLSKNAKLKLMQEIAQEYSVDWNSNNFDREKTTAPAPAPAPSHPKQDVPITDRKQQKPVDELKSPSAKKVEERNLFPRHRADPYQRGSYPLPKEPEMQQPVVRDVHTVQGSKTYYQPEAKLARAEVKDVLSSSKPHHLEKESRVEGRRVAEQNFGKESRVERSRVTEISSYDCKKNTGGSGAWDVEQMNRASGFRESNVAPPPYAAKPRDMDGASWDKDAAPGRGLDSIPERKAPVGPVKVDGRDKVVGGAALEEVEKAKLAATAFRGSNMAPPYVKPRHMHGASSAAPEQDLNPVTAEKKTPPVGLVKEDESSRGALKEVRMYMKPSGSKTDDHSNKLTSVEAADCATPKKEPIGVASLKPNPAFFRPPPYLKPNGNKNTGNPMNYPEVADRTQIESGFRLHPRSPSEVENLPVLDEYLANGDKTPKPRSVRRNHRRPPLVVEDAGEQPLPGNLPNDDRRGLHFIVDGVPVNEDYAGRVPHRRTPRSEPKERGGLHHRQDGGASSVDGNFGEIRNERKLKTDRRRRHTPEDIGPVNADGNAGGIQNERKLKTDWQRGHHTEDVEAVNAAPDTARIPTGRYHQQNDRRGPHYLDEEADEDDKIDWLLAHYSRKGIPDRKPQLQRVVSLPHEDSPKAVKVTARSASSLTDEGNPNGRPVRYQIPDYDELAARFNALKRH